jgi:hypothetical protein
MEALEQRKHRWRSRSAGKSTDAALVAQDGMNRASLLSASGLRSTRSELQGGPNGESQVGRAVSAVTLDALDHETSEVERCGSLPEAVARRGRSLPGRGSPTAKWWTIGWLVRCCRLSRARRCARASAALARPGDAVGRICPPRGGGGAFSVRARSPAVGRDRMGSSRPLAVTGERSGDHSEYSVVAMITFEGRRHRLGSAADLLASHRAGRSTVGGHAGRRRGARLRDFGRGDQGAERRSRKRIGGLLSPWTALVVTAAIASFFASAPSLQVGAGVAVIAVTSAANMSMIVAAWLSSATRLVTISWWWERGSRRSCSFSWPRS